MFSRRCAGKGQSSTQITEPMSRVIRCTGSTSHQPLWWMSPLTSMASGEETELFTIRESRLRRCQRRDRGADSDRKQESTMRLRLFIVESGKTAQALLNRTFTVQNVWNNTFFKTVTYLCIHLLKHDFFKSYFKEATKLTGQTLETFRNH